MSDKKIKPEKKEKPAKKDKHQKKAEEFEYKYKRALADYQNLLKQTAKEKSEFAKYANENLIMEIIPIYDNLKMALQHGDGENGNSWLDGVKYVVKQFADTLKNIGLEEIKTKGEKFDHKTMEAVEGRGEKVKKELRSGYKLNGKVIVPAKVIVE